jgi:diguanylate cyclase
MLLKDKKTLSLFIKIFTAIGIITILIYAIIFYIKYDADREHHALILENVLKNKARIITASLNHVEQDLNYLADVASLYHQPSADQLPKLEKTFLSFAHYHSSYQQVRFLDLDGMEVVRVDDNAGHAEITRTLQDKSKRYYFRDAKTLKPQEVSVSPLDLNIENGKIE